jgi:hypothetical protein
MEIWKKIPNYSKYEASSTGYIKTFNWKGSGQTRIMKPALDGSGYLRTMLVRDDGKTHTIKVHRIIAQTFIPTTLVLEVNHKNGIKVDNRVENLEWCTHAENIQHCIDNGWMVSHNGEKNGFSKLKEVQVIGIRAKYKPRVYTRKMLADEYGVKESTIKGIVEGKAWKHLI